MDFSRLRQGELIAGVAGIALIIFMFLPWYSLGIDAPSINLPDLPGGDQVPGIDQGLIQPAEVDDNVSGWDALTDFDGFLIAAAGLAGIALAALAAAGRRLNLGALPRGAVTAALGALATALIVWRLFAQPTPGADPEIGIFLGLVAALGVAVGALMALRAAGFELLVAAGPAPRTPSRAAAKNRGAAATSRAKASGSSRAKPTSARAKARPKPKPSSTRKRATGK